MSSYSERARQRLEASRLVSEDSSLENVMGSKYCSHESGVEYYIGSVDHYLDVIKKLKSNPKAIREVKYIAITAVEQRDIGVLRELFDCNLLSSWRHNLHNDDRFVMIDFVKKRVYGNKSGIDRDGITIEIDASSFYLYSGDVECGLGDFTSYDKLLDQIYLGYKDEDKETKKEEDVKLTDEWYHRVDVTAQMFDNQLIRAFNDPSLCKGVERLLLANASIEDLRWIFELVEDSQDWEWLGSRNYKPDSPNNLVVDFVTKRVCNIEDKTHEGLIDLELLCKRRSVRRKFQSRTNDTKKLFEVIMNHIEEKNEEEDMSNEQVENTQPQPKPSAKDRADQALKTVGNKELDFAKATARIKVGRLIMAKPLRQLFKQMGFENKLPAPQETAIKGLITGALGALINFGLEATGTKSKKAEVIADSLQASGTYDAAEIVNLETLLDKALDALPDDMKTWVEEEAEEESLNVED